MITGVLNTNSNAGIYITDEKRSKSVNVKPGTVSLFGLLTIAGFRWLFVILRDHTAGFFRI